MTPPFSRPLEAAKEVASTFPVSLLAQTVKLPAMRETWVRFLGQEDPLEKEMATLQYSCLGNPMDGGAW